MLAATMHLAPSRSQQESRSWLSKNTQGTLKDKKHAWMRFMGAPEHLKGAMKAELNILKNKARNIVARDE